MGTVILARSDRKPLDVETDIMHDYNGMLLHFYGESPQFAQQHISKQYFDMYFRNYQSRSEGLRSPYDL